MSTEKQQAFFIEAVHGEYTVRSRDIPKPGPRELLVKVKAAALNPVDWKIQQGLFPYSNTFPIVPGTDIAGDVEEVGEEVTNFSKGDRVFFQGLYRENSNHAGFQQYTISNASTTAKIPAKVTYEAASTIPVALTVSYVGLFNVNPYGFHLTSFLEPSQRGQLAGTPLVVLGGSSSVGQFVIQLAKAAGLSPIITTSSLKHTEFLKTLGATHVLDRKLSTASLRSEIEKITNAPIKYVYDAISSEETQQTGHDLLASGGELIIVLGPKVTKTDDKTVLPALGIWALPENLELLERLYSKLTGLVEDGVIVPNRYEALSGGLGGITEGLKRLQNDQVSGVKLVALPWGA